MQMYNFLKKSLIILFIESKYIYILSAQFIFPQYILKLCKNQEKCKYRVDSFNFFKSNYHVFMERFKSTETEEHYYI